MKRLSKAILAASVLIMAGSVQAAAQELRTGYFMEGYSYRYRFNPALTAQRNFISIPGAGNVSLAANSNLSLSSFLTNSSDGSLSGIMDGNYGFSSLEGFLKPVNKANIALNESILSTGFWTGRLFHTLELNAVANTSMTLTDQFFELMKSPDPAKEYLLNGISMNANAMTELAYGISIPIGNKFRIGARAKFLIGLGQASLKVDDVKLSYDQINGQWNGSGNASVDICVPSMAYFPTKGEVAENEGIACSPERQDRVKFTDVEFKMDDFKFKGLIPGFGASIDLGFSLDFAEYCTISASVTDLGFLKWTTAQKFVSEESWSFGGFRETSSAQSVKDQYDDLSDQIDDCLPFVKDGGEAAAKSTTMMEAKVNGAFELRMPFYDRWSIGLIGQADLLDKKLNWYEGRFVTTLTPTNWFSLAASYAYSTFGHNFGAMLSFNMKGLNLFVGADSILPAFKFSDVSIPVNRMNTNVSVGLNIAFGRKNHIRYELPTVKR